MTNSGCVQLRTINPRPWAKFHFILVGADGPA
jgi:hypothetical protein